MQHVNRTCGHSSTLWAVTHLHAAGLGGGVAIKDTEDQADEVLIKKLVHGLLVGVGVGTWRCGGGQQIFTTSCKHVSIRGSPG